MKSCCAGGVVKAAVGAAVFLAAAVWPSVSAAAIRYERTPSGASSTSPVTFSVAGDDFAADIVGTNIVQNNYWRVGILIRNAPNLGNSESDYVFSSECLASTTLSRDFTVNMPNGDYNGVFTFTYTTSDCNFNDWWTNGNGVKLEGSGSASDPVDFSITGSSQSAAFTGVIEHFPEARLVTKLDNRHLAGVVPVNYLASDIDDQTYPPFGLFATNPVEFYLGKTSPYGTVFWSALGKGAATGTFAFDTTKIPDGSYKFKVEAWDKVGNVGVGQSDSFTIDNTPPNFDVRVNPAFSRGEPVEIDVSSSEMASGTPALAVSQYGHEPVSVNLQAVVPGKSFVGQYDIVKGFDGPAQIAIEGEDLAGNMSTVITGTDHFAVGVKPPPPPVVDWPYDKSVTTSSLTAVSGFALNAQKVVVRVNGAATYETKDIRDGRFQVANVPLDPAFNKGQNVVAVTAYDPDGNISKPTTVGVFLDSPPQVKLLEPVKLRLVLAGKVSVRWEAEDITDKPLAYKIELSNDRGATWKIVAEKLKVAKFLWDTAMQPDGSNYMLRVTASDGIVSSYALSRVFTLNNNLPTIVLESAGDFYTPKNSRTMTGVVRNTSDRLSGLQVSADGGLNWKTVEPEGGIWNADFVRFNFTLPLVGAGSVYNVVLRGFTVSGREVKNAETARIFFDNVPPRLYPDPLPRRPVNAVLVTGSASDDFSGVEAVEYSIDNSPWYRGVIVSGLEERAAEFEIKPAAITDGAHGIGLRVVDRAGNTSSAKTQSFVFDATPPRIGSFTLRVGGRLLFPSSDDIFHIASGTAVELEFAVRGEPVEVRAALGRADLSLRPVASSSRFRATFVFPPSPTSTIKISATDTAGNRSEKSIAEISSEPSAPPAVEPRTFWQMLTKFFNTVL